MIKYGNTSIVVLLLMWVKKDTWTYGSRTVWRESDKAISLSDRLHCFCEMTEKNMTATAV